MAGGFSFDIQGLTEMVAKVDQLRDRFSEAGMLAMSVLWADDIGPKIASRLAENAPKKTGRFAGSIRYQRETAMGSVRMHFDSNVPYAGFITSGTQPHIIEPVAAQALHWHSNTGTDVFAMIVHHPGTAPNPFNQRTLDDMRGEIISSYMLVMREAARI